MISSEMIEKLLSMGFRDFSLIPTTRYYPWMVVVPDPRNPGHRIEQAAIFSTGTIWDWRYLGIDNLLSLEQQQQKPKKKLANIQSFMIDELLKLGFRDIVFKPGRWANEKVLTEPGQSRTRWEVYGRSERTRNKQTCIGTFERNGGSLIIYSWTHNHRDTHPHLLTLTGENS